MTRHLSPQPNTSPLTLPSLLSPESPPSLCLSHCHSPSLSPLQTLIARKNSALADHILSLFSSSSVHSDIVHTASSAYVRSLPKVQAAQYTVITYFYDILINESLMRGLSGLLPLSVTQFVWDQCFVFGSSFSLPPLTRSLSHLPPSTSLCLSRLQSVPPVGRLVSGPGLWLGALISLAWCHSC
jgi:hypothetical protein